MIPRLRFAMATSLALGRDDQRVVGGFRGLPEVDRASPPDAGHDLAHPALVDAETAVDPLEGAAGPLGLPSEGADPLLRVRMVLLDRVPPVHGVGVLGLAGARPTPPPPPP